MINLNRRKFIKKTGAYITFLTLATTANSSYLYKQYKIPTFTEKYFQCMGTLGKIQIFENCTMKTSQSIEAVLKRIFNLENWLSKFKINSDISILNKKPSFYHATRDDTVEVLEKSMQYNKMTYGYFDAGLGNLLSITGIDANVPLVGNNFLKINLKEDLVKIKNNKVKLNRSNSMLDLGGIAKGYIIDESIKIFKEYNIKHAAIEIGGDIKVYGGIPGNKKWQIILNCNTKNELINIHTGSIAISNGSIKKSINNINDINHHIINPKNLKSENYYKSIITLGEDSITCDVLSTTLYNLNDIDKIKKIINNFSNYEIKHIN